MCGCGGCGSTSSSYEEDDVIDLSTHTHECLKLGAANSVYSIYQVCPDLEGYPTYNFLCVHKSYTTAYACALYNSPFKDSGVKLHLDADEYNIYLGTRDEIDEGDTSCYYGYLIEETSLQE